jgi:hypothetical protein
MSFKFTQLLMFTQKRNFMKTLQIIALSLLTSSFCFSQAAYDIDEGKPAQINGIEYGFEIRNERKKDVKDETYNRFEVTVYVTNKSGCTKLMFPRQTVFGTEYQDLLADFDCLNATGKRLTSKRGSVKAREFSTPYTTTTKGSDGKDVRNTISVRVGNMLRNGDTMTDNFIVIVPEGERPRMKVRVRELMD